MTPAPRKVPLAGLTGTPEAGPRGQAVGQQDGVGVGLGLVPCWGPPVWKPSATRSAVTEIRPEVGAGLVAPRVLVGVGVGVGAVGVGVGAGWVGLGVLGETVGVGAGLAPCVALGDDEQLGFGDGLARCCPELGEFAGVPVPATAGACPVPPEPFPSLGAMACATWEMIVCGSPVRAKPPTNATITMTPMAAASRSHG